MPSMLGVPRGLIHAAHAAHPESSRLKHLQVVGVYAHSRTSSVRCRTYGARPAVRVAPGQYPYRSQGTAVDTLVESRCEAQGQWPTSQGFSQWIGPTTLAYASA